MGRTHLLFHASGFIVIRLTLSTADNPDLDHNDHVLLSAFERLPWGPAAFTWKVGDASVVGNVRACLNTVFLTLLDALTGTASCEDISQVVEEGPEGWEHLHHLCSDGRLSHPYPVSFGTQIEVADPQLAGDPVAQQAFLRAVVLPGIGVTWEPRDIEGDASDVSWYFLENQSVVFRGTAVANDVVDPTRTGLLDYLTLRRGALRSVQRDTQRVISGRRSVSRRRLHEWNLLVQSTTDDYVLSDRTGQVLALLRSRLSEQPRVRDPDALEEQVRSNLHSFSTASGTSSRPYHRSSRNPLRGSRGDCGGGHPPAARHRLLRRRYTQRTVRRAASASGRGTATRRGGRCGWPVLALVARTRRPATPPKSAPQGTSKPYSSLTAMAGLQCDCYL